MKSILIILFALSGCTQFIQSTDDEFYDVYASNGKSQNLNLLFSHNIHGETHPCGCKKFPLGGLPQVFAILNTQFKDQKYIYVDTGDTFFPSSAIPDSIKDSSRFTAIKLAESFDAFGLDFFTPGSYDFALGEEFLIEIAKEHKFQFLISNASDKLKIKHIKEAKIKYGGKNLHFISVVNPDVMVDKYKHLFTEPMVSLKESIAAIETKDKSSTKQIILLSHSGMDFDVEIAKAFPQISWIIGAHSQAFLNETRDVNKSKIVQVLSRNHHLGHIQLPYDSKGKSSYQLIGVKEELKDALKPNPYIAWLDNYKTQLDQIQEKEQQRVTMASTSHSDTKLQTSTSCMDCHDKQVDFWQGTAHSIGFKTLINSKAMNNTQCIGCHSLGFQDSKGFKSVKEVVTSEDSDFKSDEYWKDVNKALNFKASIREMTSKKRREYSKKWVKVDEKHKVVANFANIQCLHCHGQTADHPFDMDSQTLKKAPKDYANKCLTCHNMDQSPAWFEEGSKGLAKDLKREYFEQKLKMVSCPKIEKD